MDFWTIALPNWIVAISTVAAFFAAALAANATWKAVRQDRIRDAQHDAACVSATWAKGPLEHEGEEAWGILVTNGSSASFRNVQIQTTGNNHQFGDKPVEFSTLPPGEFFVQSCAKNAKYAWGQKVRVINNHRFHPVGKNTLTVPSWNFTDTLGGRWTFESETGLQQAHSA